MCDETVHMLGSLHVSLTMFLFKQQIFGQYTQSPSPIPGGIVWLLPFGSDFVVVVSLFVVAPIVCRSFS